jgi:hypothetical protein
MISRDVSYDPPLVFIEGKLFLTPDRLKRPLVVACPAFCPPDVVQQCGIFEVLAIRFGSSMERLQFVEEPERKSGYLPGVPDISAVFFHNVRD